MRAASGEHERGGEKQEEQRGGEKQMFGHKRILRDAG
jgi:hypothetical protein